jgi:uncharacterized lipoprotein YmbA
MKRSLSRALLIALAFVGGCATSERASFYTLSALPPQEQVATKAPITIAIESVSVPDLVDRPQMVVRIDASKVSVEEYSRWAEPLKSQISRVLAADLAASLPGALVTGNPSRLADAPDYRVAVGVQSFESTLGDAASIVVLWSVRSGKSGSALNGRTDVHESTQAAGYDALVDAHSRALATVSGKIASAIRTLLPP